MAALSTWSPCHSPCAGSLNDVLKRARSSPLLAAQLDWPRRLNMALDAAKGGLQVAPGELQMPRVCLWFCCCLVASAMLPDWLVRFVTRSTCAGMLYLHSCAPPIIHRDLKSANLLVDKHWRVRTASNAPCLPGCPVMACGPDVLPSALYFSPSAHPPPWPPEQVRVCDFNLSRAMEDNAVLSSMAATNPRWLAPEILSGKGYTFASDVYAFG